MQCEHLNDGVCGIASRICGQSVTTTDAACEQCQLQLRPRAENFVTACIALAAIREDKEAWRKLRKRLEPLLVMTPEMTAKAKQIRRQDAVGVECEQNVGGVCVVASHLCERPVAADGRCEACSRRADWRTPNGVTAQMAVEQRPDLAEGLECYASGDGNGPGSCLKRVLYELGVRGLRRCELDTVLRMNDLGSAGCKERAERLVRWVKADAEASGFAWVFSQAGPAELIDRAIRLSEGTYGPQG